MAVAEGGTAGRRNARASRGVGPPGDAVGVGVRVRVIREEAGGAARTRRAHVVAPADGGRRERHDEWAPRTSTAAGRYECPRLSRPLGGSREAARGEHRARPGRSVIRPRPRLREASIPGGRSPRPVRRLISKARRLALKKSKSATNDDRASTAKLIDRSAVRLRSNHELPRLDRKSSVDFMRPVYGRSYVHINDAAALSRRARCSASRDTRSRLPLRISSPPRAGPT